MTRKLDDVSTSGGPVVPSFRNFERQLARAYSMPDIEKIILVMDGNSASQSSDDSFFELHDQHAYRQPDGERRLHFGAGLHRRRRLRSLEIAVHSRQLRGFDEARGRRGSQGRARECGELKSLAASKGETGEMRIPAAILSLTAALLLLCSRAGAQEGDCARFNRADMATQLIEAYVVKTNATLYLNAGDATSSSSLKFNDHVVVLDRSPDGARIKVDRKDSQNPANGWIEKTNLICVNEAVRNNQTKLYQRVYVRTERYHTQGAAPAPAGALDRGEAVTLYQNTNQQCEGGPNACARVTRFDWFYIWAEEGDYYLISTFYSFKSRRPGAPQPMFMGWLAKSRGIPWSTGIGLRPSIELAESRGADNDEKYVCAYASPEDIGKETEDPTKCSRTYGGRRWFKRNSRLALLEETDRYYRVAAAASLFGNESRDADPAAAGGRSLYDGMDVVFVVDGTASMIKAIAAIKGGDGRPGLVQIISRKLATQLKDVGGVRFGFQIYRDSAPIQISRQDGVTDPDIERLALSTTSCAGNAEEFENAFGAVTAKEPVFPGTYVDDDDPENGFLGVYVALNQFSSCPNHMKVLIRSATTATTPTNSANAGNVRSTSRRSRRRCARRPRRATGSR